MHFIAYILYHDKIQCMQVYCVFYVVADPFVHGLNSSNNFVNIV